jgi:ribosomal protein L44E
MVATAIARGELAKAATTKATASRGGAAKPKRRRSSVYDADGNEVFITLLCLKCHKMRPLSQFGLRKMADGAIRNQPWCRTCRSAPSAAVSERKKERAADPVEVEGSPISEDSPPSAAPSAKPAARGSSVAAEVAAALAAGRS